MCTPDVAMLCPCCVWQGCAMPLRHHTIGSSRARTLAVPCVLTPQLPPCAIAHLTPTHSPSSPSALSISLSFPHRPTPILSTILSPTCALKRFPLTSPRKLPLTCVKRGFLRTAEPHGTSQLSPCAPLMSQCHVYVMPGRDEKCPCAIAPSAPPARELLPCPVSQPSTPTLRNPTSHSSRTFHPHPTRFLLLSRLTFPHSPDSLSIHLSFPHWPSPILATFLSMACVLKRFPLASPRKLPLTCVKRDFLRTAGPH